MTTAASLWDMDTLNRTPQHWPAPEFAEEGVKALFIEGEPYQGRPTRVFAWYGCPAVAPGETVPAMVLVHGGGGTAFAEWVRLWTGRGYAAIAMDTCGCVPRGEYGNWQRHADGGPAGWGGFEQIDEPLTDQWTYQAVSAVIRAHSWLRERPEVDAGRIGITGISWGGFLTCIAAGLDARLRFAAPVYGCGKIGDNSCWLEIFANMGAEKSARWLELWDPSQYLPRAAMPLLWVTGTNDFAYPLDSVQKSYRLPGGPRSLCIRVRMEHAHGGPGENPAEIKAMADHLLRGGPALATVTGQGRDGNRAWATFTGESVAQAELIYTTEGGRWFDRNWQAAPAQLLDGRVEAELPEGTTVYYFNLITIDELVASSEHEALPGYAEGLNWPAPVG